MTRIERKLKHLEQKVADKQGRSPKRENGQPRVGAKLKRWKKSVAAYKPLTEQTSE